MPFPILYPMPIVHLLLHQMSSLLHWHMVHTTIPHVLEKLSLTFGGLHFCLFFSTMLVSLNPPSASSFPNLRILVLWSVEYANSESFPTLFIAFPVLILEIHKRSLIRLHDRFFKMNKVEFHEFMIVIEEKIRKVNDFTNFHQQMVNLQEIRTMN